MERLQTVDLTPKEIERLVGAFSSELISYDLDGILARSADAALSLRFNPRFGTAYTPHQIRSWSQLAVWAMEQGLPEEEAKTLDWQIWADPEVIAASPPSGGLRQLHWILHQAGVPQHIITSRNHEMAPVTLAWFKRHMPWVRREDIHIRIDGELDKGEHFKAQKAKELGVTVHFEDSPEHTELILQETNVRVYYVSNLEHNFDGNQRVMVVQRWNPSLRELYPFLIC